jgi:hypothetical protein
MLLDTFFQMLLLIMTFIGVAVLLSFWLGCSISFYSII